MTIAHNTDYVGEGLGRLLEQFKNKPRIAALLSSWLDEVQAVEDALWQIYVDRLLQNILMQGTNADDLLNTIGKIVGQGREGLDNAGFAILITARIQANRSKGQRPNLITIMALLAPGLSIYVKDFPPASVYVWPVGPVPVPPNLIAFDFLKPAVSAGVKLMFVWTRKPIANTFIGGSIQAAAPIPTINQSPGSISVPGVGGGLTAGVFQVEGS